jgi:hypothetical protein
MSEYFITGDVLSRSKKYDTTCKPTTISWSIIILDEKEEEERKRHKIKWPLRQNNNDKSD